MNNNDLMSTLMSVLGNPDAKDKLGDLVSSLGGGTQQQQQQQQANIQNNPAQETPNPFANADPSLDMVVKIKSMLDQFNNTDDTRIGLLTSIKPYMRGGRGKNIDMAVKFIQLINFTSGFKNG